MTNATTETRARKRPGSKQNRVQVTVQPHLRLAMDTQSEVNYDDIVAKAICEALGKTDRELRLTWRDHIRESFLKGEETPYCWKGMRGLWS